MISKIIILKRRAHPSAKEQNYLELSLILFWAILTAS